MVTKKNKKKSDLPNDAPAKFSFIKYANYSVQTCNVMVAPQWKSNISGDVTIVWFSEV
jgi:hypothetical protein